MLYIYTIITASLLVTGQAFWKSASKVLTIKDASLLDKLVHLLFSRNFLIGAFLYVAATLLYIWLFSKYPYFAVQITLVSFSIVLSLAISSIIFREGLSTVNYLGALIIIIGVFLVTWKTQ